MTNFEKITETPETLGTFLASLPIASGTWDEAFHRMFCDGCQAEDCDGQDCLHKAERNNPLWWLMQEAEVEQDTPPEELPEPLREIKQKYPTVKIYKTSQVSHGLKGNLHYMEVGAAMMFELGKVLWAGERKYRVTIECDPETGKFEAKREDEPLERRPMWRGGRLDMEPDHGTSREGWKEWPSEPHRTEKLFEEIKAKIIESGCTPDEGINVLGSLRTVCIDNLKREKNPPRP